MQNHRRHLAAILFTDIVGYTAMMQQNEMEAVTVMKRYTSVLQNAVSTNSGQILNDYGDGSLCSFPSVNDALKCALELQEQLQNRPVVPLRIGVHIGEIFFEDGKVMGDGVNIASRIQSLGQSNTILFSEEVNNKIKNRPEYKSVSLGQFEFKNVGEAIEVFALANDGLLVPKRELLIGKLKETQKKSFTKKIIVAAALLLLLIVAGFLYKKSSGHDDNSGKENTIAVLPFRNISVNKEENEPFCVGVALELQRKLEWLGGLIPIAPQSVEKYRDSKMSPVDIATELGGISFLVQGSVLRDKNKIKVFISLIDGRTGKEKWSADYPGEVEDVFSLQENIAQEIASQLQVKITPDEQNRISRVSTKSARAIDAYNEALTSYVRLATAVHPLYWDSLPSSPQLNSEYRKTLTLCDSAIKTDPSMAEVYVLKGQTYFYSISDWYASAAKKALISDSMRLLANTALQIDKSSADAYLLISRCFNGSDSALIYLEKALTINPNSFDVNRELGIYYAAADPEKAIRFSKKAIRLSPLSVWTPSVYQNLGFAYHNFGEFEKAESYVKKAIELSNNSMIAVDAVRMVTVIYLHWGKADSVIKYGSQNLDQEPNALYEIAEAYCNLKNDCAKASELYERLWNRYNNHTNPHRWAIALMNIGKTKEAKEKIEQAIKEYKERNDTLSYDYAGICALSGQKAKALDILSKFDWQWGSLYLIQNDKLFDNVRNEKEFKDILRKAHDEKTKLREKIRKMEERGEL
ncbi:MAG TPA: adenylate/guanylate cyclase domain-containing protein [Chitinophagaceae bacterium]|nr:adenylate/guanylate cyclase domain-containing protein [Chitinophagaceae bacterium]